MNLASSSDSDFSPVGRINSALILGGNTEKVERIPQSYPGAPSMPIRLNKISKIEVSFKEPVSRS